MDEIATLAGGAADRAVLVACMMASENQTKFEDPSRLHNLIEARAHHVALSLAKRNLVARDDAPGYVKLALGRRVYNFPYYLACVFPDIDDLGPIDQLVDQIRLSADNSFCLSGSSTSLRRVSAISDIDFCEYFRDSAAKLVGYLKEKERPSANCLLAVLSIRGEDRSRPFLDYLTELAAELEVEATYRDLQRVKLDFLARLEGRGTLAATNMVLPIEGDDDPRLTQSFQFQEAVIHENDTAPKRPLVLPDDLGAYLAWLKAEAQAYFEKATKETGPQKARLVFKALKRMMSWLLVVEAEDDWESIVEVLDDDVTREIVLQARASEVASLLDTIPKGFDQAILDAFGATLPQEVRKDDGAAEFVDDAYALARNLLHTISMLSSGG
jgi:hypothetical protein